MRHMNCYNCGEPMEYLQQQEEFYCCKCDLTEDRPCTQCERCGSWDMSFLDEDHDVIWCYDCGNDEPYLPEDE